ncbi:NAD-glutamate dehydrogenase, partial [Nocardia colli]
MTEAERSIDSSAPADAGISSVPGKLPGDASKLTALYFGWIPPDATPRTATERAERILRHHLELAMVRDLHTPNFRIYRDGDGTGLGTAIQLVNDDMPLLVESVTSALRRLGITVTEVIHPMLNVTRDRRGRLQAITADSGSAVAESNGREQRRPESWMHIQLGTAVDDRVVDQIEHLLPSLLADLRRAVDDTAHMIAMMTGLAARLEHVAGRIGEPELAPCADLLRWLANDHFNLLGYGYYSTEDGDGRLYRAPVPEVGLGVFSPQATPGILLPDWPVDRPLLCVFSGASEAPLPGPPHHCLISIAEYETAGPAQDEPAAGRVRRIRGEHVFIGTFSVTGLHENILDIPLISQRIHQVIAWAGLDLNSFSGQAMLEVMQSFPRVELFATDAHTLFETISAVMTLSLRRQVQSFIRQDPRSGALYCLVYLPRDRYSAEVRLRMTEILRAEFDGEHIAYSARATESELAVVYFTVYPRADAAPVDLSESNCARIQELLFATTRTWTDRLVAKLVAASALAQSAALAQAAAFPVDYQEAFGTERAVADLRRLLRLDGDAIDINLYRVAESPSGEWRFTLYVAGAGVSLSEVLPLLHSLGVQVVDEQPYRITLPGDAQRWIYDFRLRIPASGSSASFDAEVSVGGAPASGSHLPDVRVRVAEAVEAMWFGQSEIDQLNELVLRGELNWRQVVVLRAYAKYLQQIGFAYSFASVARVLLTNLEVTRSFVGLFESQFDVDGVGPAATQRAARITGRLHTLIDRVVSMDTDRILRAIHGLITATLRTNHFRRTAGGTFLDYLSLKFDARNIAELPEPRPRFEIFVYSPRVEGVHLRFGAIARGGLRWSDRTEDFRTEILALAKAQTVKNAVIVPTGAKGGFVVKRPPESTGDAGLDRQALLAEGISCYRTFVSGLLDLTDNVDSITREVLPPDRIVRRDGDDTYLVVAADKGTATFSDTANEVARGYHFWLGDAFASGGSL